MPRITFSATLRQEEEIYCRFDRPKHVSEEDLRTMRKNYSAADMNNPPTAWQQLLPRNHSSIDLNTHQRYKNGPPSPLRAFGPRQTMDQQSLYSFTHKNCPNAFEVDSPMIRYRPAHQNVQQRKRKRLIHKSGLVNITKEKIGKKKQRFLKDFFTTLVDIQWRYNLLIFALGFILSWLGFAIIWWLIAFSHGDFDRPSDDPEWKFCITDMDSFTSAFLFSIETQHTIGYGGRSTTEECPEAIFIMCIQSITGVMIQAFMVGVVFAKLTRPKSRAKTLMFSRNATICMRDGKLYLMIRVGDMRKSHIIESHISALLFKRKVTLEGEVIPFHQTRIEMRHDNGNENILFIWPITIVHEIDKGSPFYNMSAEDLLHERFELIVVLEGIVESTTSNTQARTSYLPNELLWGHRFEQMMSFKKDTGEYKVDYSRFNSTYEVDTPLCSAAELDAYVKNGGRFPSVSLPPSRGPCLISLRQAVESVYENRNGEENANGVSTPTTSSTKSSNDEALVKSV